VREAREQEDFKSICLLIGGEVGVKNGDDIFFKLVEGIPKQIR
jgi:hypothetical protein